MKQQSNTTGGGDWWYEFKGSLIEMTRRTHLVSPWFSLSLLGEEKGKQRKTLLVYFKNRESKGRGIH